MKNNISKPPIPTCEPVKSYASGTTERDEAQLEYQKTIRKIINIPMWINGKNIYSYNQRWEDGEGIFQDQSKIDPDLLKQCLKVGEQVFKDLKKDHEFLIQCRIDFACCVNNDNHCRDFFINEIEISPTI